MDVVGEDEVLYRSIMMGRNRYVVHDDGTTTISSSAFLDPGHRPSVDRSHLCKNGASDAQKASSDGVTSLVAGGVRAIRDVGYDVDVMPDPIKDHPTLPDNPAHAVIFTKSPSTITRSEKDRVFRQLRTALARQATQRGWVIMPEHLR